MGQSYPQSFSPFGALEMTLPSLTPKSPKIPFGAKWPKNKMSRNPDFFSHITLNYHMEPARRILDRLGAPGVGFQRSATLGRVANLPRQVGRVGLQTLVFLHFPTLLHVPKLSTKFQPFWSTRDDTSFINPKSPKYKSGLNGK